MKNEKQALVTGASSGIGEAFAYDLAKQGYDLVLTARRRENLSQIQEKIKFQYGRSVHIFAIDLSDAKAPEKLFLEIKSQNLTIDLLVNNAGYGLNGESVQIDENDQLKMIDLNCRSLVSLCVKFGAEMKKRKAGTIINVASVGGFSPTPYFSTYGGTKAFVLSYSQALAEELKPYQVHVMAICPGTTLTEFEQRSNYEGRIPPKWALQTPADVVREGLIGLAQRKTVVVTGKHNRIAVLMQKLLPARYTIAMASQTLKPK